MHIHTIVAGPLHTNCFVVFDDYAKKAIVIDAGPFSAPHILEFLAEHQLHLEMAVGTHGHFDHVWDLDALRKKTKCRVAIGNGDAHWLTHPPDLGFHEAHDQPRFKPDLILHANDVLKVGSIELRVLSTPGHTKGSICLYDAHSGTLFSGDTLFRKARGRTDFPEGNIADIKRSLNELLLLPEGTRVLPAHNQETTIGAERKWIEAMNG